jgi:NADH-quinone oxidoreductase subunit K
MNAGPGQYAVLSTIVFGLGIFGVLARQNALSVLCSVVLLFVAPVIALVGFAHTGSSGQVAPVGDALALLAVVAAAAEGLAGTALTVLAWRRLNSVQVDDLADPAG